MNSVHLHLLVNHFPIIGVFFGIAILVYGIFRKNALVLNIAYTIFIFSMIMGKISMITGDKAEHFLEKTNNFPHVLIEFHEEKAEIFMKTVYLLGSISIIGIITNKKKHPKAQFLAFLILLIAGTSIFFSQPVGTSGGRIHHNEIRKN
ncbi:MULTISPECIES: hypothetical protein [Flavobacterium]|uniref:Uncharacterized protein n=1 Tax=Flavobacterium covae TaxID=2906076 RepID=A0ABW8PH13_9FLAO|nr:MULTISPECIES: hypothetical protein [Flavobacterium]OXA79498.1 hypothetical protein B0A56_07695 [Flavobacterium columnare NBRC 100251 = ATCC 23463]AMA49103.1 hypothetical protein AWN65_06340 [Flavobacterium covae]AND64825.1 hypothetical protein AX766_10685 [Flavobacterium covae]MCJ1807019.1 hypothetical protein [Flavobacterium covae]MCJ1810033.1 hypothetical protein [Flavobacterium covae]